LSLSRRVERPDVEMRMQIRPSQKRRKETHVIVDVAQFLFENREIREPIRRSVSFWWWI
jgi:hypothetical protein